jgi:hypothetical protein
MPHLDIGADVLVSLDYDAERKEYAEELGYGIRYIYCRTIHSFTSVSPVDRLRYYYTMSLVKNQDPGTVIRGNQLQNHDHNILDKFIIIIMLSYPKTKFREGGLGDNRFLKRVPPAGCRGRAPALANTRVKLISVM